MSLTDNGNMYMPVAPIGNYYGNGGFGGGFGGWGDSIWIIILLLFGWGGFGGGFGGFGFDGGMGLYPWMNQAQLTQGGFDQAAVQSTLAGIQSSITNGFSNAEVSACNRAMNEMQTSYNSQIATMNQNFANQQSLQAQLNGMQAQQAQCCCDNKAGLADIRYTIATEGCADRAAVSDALRDVIAANTASTQRILDQMCSDKIDAKNEKIAELQNQLSMAQLAASQNAQTAAIIANNEAQTTALEQYLAPVPRPAYIVQNPSCCNQNVYGCGLA